MTTRDFSVRGQRVLVVGAARSGVAAALLLVRRGATVTLTDRKDATPDAEALRGAGVALELGAH
ncbi:MAG: NAD(P)-binding domain-containing protein, partial [Vicinamibacterales bacterium]